METKLLIITTLLFTTIGCIKQNEIELNLQCQNNEVLIDGKCTTESLPPELLKNIFSCINIPRNATLCLNDDQNLLRDEVSTLVDHCGANICEYTCRIPGYILSNNSCESTSNLSWQKTLENIFEIVETFDQLQDWKGINNLHGYDNVKTNMPKKIDGTDSIWDMYDDWSYKDSIDDWIKDHGPLNVWKGSGKSLRMDLSQDGQLIKVGPSRFGLYFGSNKIGEINAYATSGLENSGHKDIYYFYMVKIPNNMFPTSNGGDWTNDTYKWWSYHKFATMSAGFTNSNTVSGAGGCRWEYGCSYVLTGLNMCGSVCPTEYSSTVALSHSVRIADSNNPIQTWIQKDVVVKDGFGQNHLNVAASQNKWIGIEFHISSGTAGNHNGRIEAWVYNEDGTSFQVTNRSELRIMQAGTDIAYNKFFFGGNISYQKDVDIQELDVTYYVDDFIINKQRIGPTYFQLLLDK